MPFSDRIRAAGDALARRYARHERVYDLLFFGGGVTFDLLTLRRIDNLFDNVLLIAYLSVLATVIVLGMQLRVYKARPFVVKYRSWIRPVTRFVLGTLFSALVIFYSRSVVWTEHSAFWFLLVIGFVATEFLHHRLTTISGLIVLFFFLCATYLAFAIPILAGVMTLWTFRAAIILALAAASVMLFKAHRLRAASRQWHIYLGAVLLLVSAVGMDLAYRTNWIPPVPLAVRTGGVYHHVERNESDFTLAYEASRRGFFAPEYARLFIWDPGDTVYCFTAVFAPTRLSQDIYHVWQKYHPETDSWESTDRINYKLTGGRDEGFRGVTYKRLVSPGRWRVLVETTDNKRLVQIPFTIVEREPGQSFSTRTMVR